MNQINQTLYRISSTRKILEWSVYVDGPSYTTISGYTDGKKQTHTTNIKEMRNSKSLEDQAVLEATSQWNLKRKTMYPTIEEAFSAHAGRSLFLGGYSPMLAKELNPKKPSFSIAKCYEQPKLDGKRIIARKIDGEVLLSARSGAIQITTPHINEQLSEVMLDGEIWDGEIYKHGLELEDILSLVQSSKNRKDTTSLEYHVYDFPRVGELNELAPFSSRLDAFQNRFYADSMIHDNVVAVRTRMIKDFNEADKHHTEYVEDGYEGTILRNPLAAYENKRTKNLLKFKKFQDAEFPIVGVEEGKGKLEGHAGAFICQMLDGRTFKAKMEGEISALQKYLDHPENVVGKMLTVRFFALTKHGIPRFPVGVRIRGED